MTGKFQWKPRRDPLQPWMVRNHIAVIDFGSQYTQLIVRRIRELGFFSKLYQPAELNACGQPAAVILSGGPRSVSEATPLCHHPRPHSARSLGSFRGAVGAWTPH